MDLICSKGANKKHLFKQQDVNQRTMQKFGLESQGPIGFPIPNYLSLSLATKKVSTKVIKENTLMLKSSRTHSQ